MDPRTPSTPGDFTDSDGRNDEHRVVQDLLGAYALGAVEPDEARAVAAHVARCPLCRADLARLRTAVAAIPLSLEERDLPPISRYRLEARLLHDLHQPAPSPNPIPATPATPATAAGWAGWPEPVPGAHAPGAWVVPAAPPRAAVPAPTDAPAVGAPPPARPARPRRLPLAWLGWTAAALLLFATAGLLLWNLDLRRDLDDRDPPVPVALDAVQAADGARATMTYLADAGVMVVALHGAPPPSPDEVYQLWLVHDEVVSPAGIFDHDTAECAVAVEDPATYDQVVITREPGPFGSASSVGPTILVAPIGSA